jgi:uncharacterized protein (TIGR04255 family)
MTRPADLPDYARPPIDEVAIAVHFAAPIPEFEDAHAWLFWQSNKQKYPDISAHPRIIGVLEDLDEGAPAMQELTLPFPPQGGRTWLVSQDDVTVVQVQNDRFVRNWRRRADEYPHFGALVKEFWTDYRAFRSHLEREGLKPPQVQQVEVTYINWISDLPMSSFLRVGHSAHLEVNGVDRLPSDQTWFARYGVRNADGQLYARLRVQCAPAVRNPPGGEPEAGIQYALTFVAPFPSDDADDDVVHNRLFDGSYTIVRSFTALTTREAHDAWGRTQ